MEQQTINMEEINEYLAAKATVKRLEKNPLIINYIQQEGKRLEQEWILKEFENTRKRFPLVTDEDLHWLKQCEGNNHRTLKLYYVEKKNDQDNNNEDTDVEVVRVIRSQQGEHDSNNNYREKCFPITMAAFLPFEITHLWGGGYKALFDASI
jgi:hypothetical protein